MFKVGIVFAREYCSGLHHTYIILFTQLL